MASDAAPSSHHMRVHTIFREPPRVELTVETLGSQPLLQWEAEGTVCNLPADGRGV